MMLRTRTGRASSGKFFLFQAAIFFHRDGDVNTSPSFSPDGQRLAFYRLTYVRDGDGSIVDRVESIYVADLNTQSVANLNCPKGTSPAWRRTSAQPDPTPSRRRM